MNIPRSSGILLHPTSLPGPFGIGDLGPQAFRFAEQLHQAGQKIWQILPLGPPGKGNSPYQCLSSCGGNPMLISPELLVERGYLSKNDIAPTVHFSDACVQFDQVAGYKRPLLRKAFASFSENPEYLEFERNSSWWLDPLARFMALKSVNNGRPWTHFAADRTPPDSEIRYYKFVQYEFARQWTALKSHCSRLGISVLGDIPFYVEHDSVDVWSHPEYFDLDEHGQPRTVGGVPPDYFSAAGQLWGNPTYRWEQLEKDGYKFWVDRLRGTFERVDVIRLDHFRGFEAFWEVPAGETTARNGHWRKGPGRRLFTELQKSLGERLIVAENLGVITPEVEALRHAFRFLGMAVLQFAFSDEDSVHRPHHYDHTVAAFTGTHDNDTTRGWWDSLRHGSGAHNGELRRAACYLQFAADDDEEQIHWRFIAAVMTSSALIAVFPLQDVLGLGSDGRMNIPGRARGNWRWRVQPDAFEDSLVTRLGELTRVCAR
jgi:4-alpha-glucanotransferase